MKRARAVLEGEKEKETLERFVTGWVVYHFHSPRYRLMELVESEGNGLDA